MRALFLLVGTLQLAALLSARSPHEAAQGETVSRAFEARYAAWRQYVDAEIQRQGLGFRSSLPGSLFYDNQPFRDIVSLGPPALPYMMHKLRQDWEVGRMLSAITKWNWHIERTEDEAGKRVWTVVEFRDMAGRTGPPDNREIWLRWWRENPKWTADRFAGLYGEWKKLKEDGKDEEGEGKCQAMKDLGIAALPYMIDRVKQGDRDLMPAISCLVDAAVAADAEPPVCLDWWDKNKEHWRIPFPKAKEEPKQPTQAKPAEKPAPQGTEAPQLPSDREAGEAPVDGGPAQKSVARDVPSE